MNAMNILSILIMVLFVFRVALAPFAFDYLFQERGSLQPPTRAWAAWTRKLRCL
ncbi:hypothetical protein B0H12DRAFT_1149750 [Mycena haematopus]|nr:hypothetical protein B0H12DRAFT_1149750 [Mycena haematopus]